MSTQGATTDAAAGRWSFVRYGLSGVMLAGVVAYLMFGENKGAGIFAALVAVVLTRVLVLGVGDPGAPASEPE